LRTSKLALPFSLLVGGALAANVVSSDRFLIKILDRTVSVKDLIYQHRNLEALYCVYEDSFVVQYLGPGFVKELGEFLRDFPTGDEAVRTYLHGKEAVLKKIRFFFKVLRYSEDQRTDVSPKLTKLIRESARENKCRQDILYKDSLKTNFITLLETELYLRARYGNQLKVDQRFESVRPSIELFVESLDKQFSHEYYW
jgi:hypothetical protein